MCLVKIAEVEGCRIKRAIFPAYTSNCMFHPDNKAELFWRGSNDFSESFFKSIQANV